MTGILGTLTWWARQVVLQRAAVVAAVTAVVHVVVVFGFLHSGQGDAAVNWTGRVIDLLGMILGLAAIRAGVTPADPAKAPRSSNGRPLVEKNTVRL